MNTRLIAICGVDGSGKSSIVNELEKSELLANSVFLRRKKAPPSNQDTINQFCTRRYKDSRDWIKGPYAEAIGVGLAFDYLRFYETDIEPNLGKVDYIVTDRYTACFICYLKSIGSTFNTSELFQHTIQPDLYVHVVVSPTELESRYKTRNSGDDDENFTVMKSFKKSYDSYFSSFKGKVLELHNNGTLTETMDNLYDRLRLFFWSECLSY